MNENQYSVTHIAIWIKQSYMGQETKNRVLIMWSLTLLIIKIRLLEWQFFWIVRNCFFSLRQQ